MIDERAGRWPSTARAGRARARSAACWRSASAGICSTAAPCTGWWPWRAPRPGWPPMIGPGHARLAARPAVPLRHSAATGRSWCCSPTRTSPPDPHRGQRRRRLAGGRLAGGPGGLVAAPAGLRGAPGPGGGRARHGHRRLPGRPPQDLPGRPAAEERARRRYNQLKEKDSGVSLAALSREIAARDRQDESRPISPLVPAEDADRGRFHDARCRRGRRPVWQLGRQRELWK